MTQNDTTKKKTTTKKVVAKKTITPKEVVQEIPKRTKRIEIDRNEMILCRSMTNGVLIYVSDRTRNRYVWSDFGTVQYIDMGELLDMRASHPKFLNEVQLIVEDDDAVEYLGLTKVYETVADFGDLDEFFNKSTDELSEILEELPSGIKRTIANRARTLIEDGTLDQLNKIKLLEDKLKVDLKMFAE